MAANTVMHVSHSFLVTVQIYCFLSVNAGNVFMWTADTVILVSDGRCISRLMLSMYQERFSQEGGSGNDQITTLQSQVEEVKGVMTQNIERVLERGQRLEELMDKTTDLEANVSTAVVFSVRTRHLTGIVMDTLTVYFAYSCISSTCCCDNTDNCIMSTDYSL